MSDGLPTVAEITDPTHPVPITVRVTAAGEPLLDLSKHDQWPRVTEIASVLIDGQHVSLRWPHLTLRFANAEAVYQVETCERGQWRGTLVEGWIMHVEEVPPS